MVGKLFKKEHTLLTSLSEDEVFRKLANHSVGGNLDGKKISTFFSGKFNKEKHWFRLLQVFDYGPRNQIRPEIVGTIDFIHEETRITLKIGLPSEMSVLLDFALILNLTFLAILPFMPLPEEFPKSFFYIGLPITMIIFFLMTNYYFKSKTTDCLSLICRIVGARVVD